MRFLARKTEWRGLLPAALLLALAVPGCAALIGESDLQRTWSNAYVAAPGPGGSQILTGTGVARIMRAAGGQRRYPVVIYLHGCTGMGPMERDFGDSLAAIGFVFIAPDSMARTYRPLQCDPRTHTGGKNLFVFDFRLAEISFALDRLKGAAWVDRGNMFLMGGSEGGVAAALYRGAEFNARVIFQWTCHGAHFVRGLDGPEDTPVFAVVNRDDPWYRPETTANQSGDCGAFFRDRGGSISLVLQRQGVHDVLDLPSVRMAIRDFLEQRLRQPLPPAQ